MRVNPNRMEQSEADPPLAPSWGWNGRMTLGYISFPIPRHEWPVWVFWRLPALALLSWSIFMGYQLVARLDTLSAIEAVQPHGGK